MGEQGFIDLIVLALSSESGTVLVSERLLQLPHFQNAHVS